MGNFIKRIQDLGEVEVSIKTVKEDLGGRIKETGEDYIVVEQQGTERIVNIGNIISVSKLKLREKPAGEESESA